VTEHDDMSIVSPTGDPEADSLLLAGVRDYLGRHEAINTILLSGFLASDAFDPSTPVLVAQTEQAIVGLATAYPGFNLLLSHIERGDAVAALVSEAVRREIEIPGVMGPSRSALEFAQRWQGLTGGSYSPGMAQRILAATTVRVPVAVPGTWRHMTAGDHPALVEWLTGFGIEIDNLDPERARQFGEAMLERLDDRSGGLIWIDEAGVPVSFARYKAPTFTGIRIGPVYTPPEQRRRGYAGAVTAAATQLMQDRGYAFVCLYTNAANPTSNHVYEAIGYEFVAGSMQYRFRPSHTGSGSGRSCGGQGFQSSAGTAIGDQSGQGK